MSHVSAKSCNTGTVAMETICFTCIQVLSIYCGYMSLYKDGNYLNKTTSSVYSSIFIFNFPLLTSATKHQLNETGYTGYQEL